MGSIVPRAYPRTKKPKLGRPPRAAKPSTVRIAIRITEAERATWLRSAGERPLADWIREVCALAAKEQQP